MVLIILSLLFIIVGINCKINVIAEKSNFSIVNNQETIENIMKIKFEYVVF